MFEEILEIIVRFSKYSRGVSTAGKPNRHAFKYCQAVTRLVKFAILYSKANNVRILHSLSFVIRIKSTNKVFKKKRINYNSSRCKLIFILKG